MDAIEQRDQYISELRAKVAALESELKVERRAMEIAVSAARDFPTNAEETAAAIELAKSPNRRFGVDVAVIAAARDATRKELASEDWT